MLVDEEARLEVVRAVEDESGLVKEQGDVVVREVVAARLDCDARVDCSQPLSGTLRLRKADVCLCIERLALEVGQLDDVTVDEDEPADAGAAEQLSAHRAE